MIYGSATRLLSRHGISALIAAVALGASGAMLLGAMQPSAFALSTGKTVQYSSKLLGPITTVHVPALTQPTSSGLPGAGRQQWYRWHARPVACRAGYLAIDGDFGPD